MFGASTSWYASATVRSVVAGTKPPTAQDAFRLAPELVAARFEALSAAAQGCDALLATGLMPAGARDVAEKLGIRYVLACFHIFGLPSRHFPPGRRPGTPSPQDETDNRVLWEQDAQRVNGLYGAALNSRRAAIGLTAAGYLLFAAQVLLIYAVARWTIRAMF